ncbi:hypothetical protein [Pontibacter brevis]
MREVQWKFIAVHAVAAFLMILGARELFMLLHAGVVSMVGGGAPAETATAFALRHPNAPLGQVPESYFHGIAVCGLMGLAASCLLAWMEAGKRDFAKTNVLLVAILGFGIAKVITESFFHLHHVVPSLHDISEVLGLKILFLVNTLLLLSAALLLVLREHLKRRPLNNL